MNAYFSPDFRSIKRVSALRQRKYVRFEVTENDRWNRVSRLRVLGEQTSLSGYDLPDYIKRGDVVEMDTTTKKITAILPTRSSVDVCLNVTNPNRFAATLLSLDPEFPQRDLLDLLVVGVQSDAIMVSFGELGGLYLRTDRNPVNSGISVGGRIWIDVTRLPQFEKVQGDTNPDLSDILTRPWVISKFISKSNTSQYE